MSGGQESGVTRDDIRDAFRFILGREPGSVQDIDYHVGLNFKNRQALIGYFTCTDEFRKRYQAMVSAGLTPPLDGPATGGLNRPATVFLGDRVLTHTHRGHKIYVFPRDLDLAPHIMMNGGWETHVEAAVLRQLRPGMRTADIGANIGYHTINMAAAVGPTGEVHAFEANPEVAKLLKATIFINGVRDWVRLHQLAVMDQPGHITLAVEPDHFGSGNSVFAGASAQYHADYSVKHEVPAVTLDGVFGNEGAPFDLMHLDIEGSEPLAIRGGAGLIDRSPNLIIVAEWSVGMMAARGDVAEFVNWLAARGFRYWQIRHGDAGLDPLAPSETLNLPHCDLMISRNIPA